jgi:hypothetical protein
MEKAHLYHCIPMPLKILLFIKNTNGVKGISLGKYVLVLMNILMRCIGFQVASLLQSYTTGRCSACAPTERKRAFQLSPFPGRQMSTQGCVCTLSILEIVARIELSVLRSYDKMRWFVPVAGFCPKLRNRFQVVRRKVLKIIAALCPMDVEWGACFRPVIPGNGDAIPDVFTPKGAHRVLWYFVSVHQYSVL